MPWKGFYNMPMSTRAREISRYVKVDINSNIPVDVYCFPNDPRVCPIFDKKGNTAGIQISVSSFEDLTEYLVWTSMTVHMVQNKFCS